MKKVAILYVTREGILLFDQWASNKEPSLPSLVALSVLDSLLFIAFVLTSTTSVFPEGFRSVRTLLYMCGNMKPSAKL
jgi:hypothetical protein